MKQTEPNVHKVLLAMRELEKHPAVGAYLTLGAAFNASANENLLSHLAACPLLPQHDKMPDDSPIFGMNDWKLTVGDIRMARRLNRR